MTYLSLGKQLKALRNSAGLKYKDFSLHPNSINKIENTGGYSDTSLNRYISELEDFSGYSVEFIVRWGQKKNKQAGSQENNRF